MKRYLIISLLFSLTLPVIAQKDSVWKKELKQITIVAERSEIYSTGSRTERPDSLLQHIFKSTTLATLLDASGGLILRSYGPGILASSSLRGGNAHQTALTWNGISINSPVNGLVDFNLIPSFLFDGITVLPGISGSLQGSGAISGGINLNNSKTKQDGFYVELMQTVGSFRTYSGGLKLLYIKNKWSHSTKGFYTITRNNYPFINSAEAGNPKQKLANAAGTNYTVLHESGFESHKAGTMKMSYWGTFADRQIPPTLLMKSSNAKQVDHIQKGMFIWSKAFNKVSIKFQAVLQKDYLLYSEEEIDINSVSNSWFFTNDAELRFKLFKNSSSSAGVVQSYARARVANILVSDTTTLNQSDRNQVAFWVSHFHQIQRLRTRISASVRQEIVDGKALPVIPSLGFKTRLHKNLDVFGQIGRVYRIPTLNDLHWMPGGNPELKPESGWASELSADFHKGSKRVDYNTSITAYSRLITNWIQWQPVNAQLWSPVNIGKVHSRGLEFRSNLKWLLTKKLYSKLGMTLDYTQSENVDKTSANYQKQLLYVPFYKSSGFIGIGYLNTVLVINGIWVGKRYVSTDNMDSIPAYGLINMTINQSIKLKETETNVFFRVNNILNKNYEAIVWRPMPGINYELGLNVKW